MCYLSYDILRLLIFQMYRYMKENFNQTQYPSDVVTTPDKFRHLVKAFYSEVSDSDKEVCFLFFIASDKGLMNFGRH